MKYFWIIMALLIGLYAHAAIHRVRLRKQITSFPIAEVQPPPEPVPPACEEVQREPKQVILARVHHGSNIGLQQISENITCIVVDGKITKGCLKIEKENR